VGSSEDQESGPVVKSATTGALNTLQNVGSNPTGATSMGYFTNEWVPEHDVECGLWQGARHIHACREVADWRWKVDVWRKRAEDSERRVKELEALLAGSPLPCQELTEETTLWAKGQGWIMPLRRILRLERELEKKK
jgi:hypothetical protein